MARMPYVFATEVGTIGISPPLFSLIESFASFGCRVEAL